jgi:putative aldouronate transport system substrate-binding protein
MEKKKSFVVLTSIISIACLIAGCSSTNTSSGTTGTQTPATPSTPSAPAAPEKPFKISIGTNFDGVEFPQPGNEVVKAIEKATNAELDIKVFPGDTLREKLPVMVASGDLPMAVAIINSQIKLPYMVNSFTGGAFWDLGPHIKNYPNLSKIDPIIYKNISVDGKIYGLPRVRDLSRGAFLYRKDWLDALGMKEPTTVDEFYKMLQAFTTGDPDKNGKADTYGMVATADNIKAFTIFFGAPHEWEEKDGKFTAAVTTNEYLEGVKYFKKLYDEKLVNSDFAITDRAKYEEAFSTGKAGVEVDTVNVGIKMDERLKKANPKGEVALLSVLSGPKGKRVAAANGTNGIFSIPKSTVKTEAELKQVLGFFDRLAGKDAANLLRWGIEGKHYKIVNGKAEPTTADYINEVNSPYTLTLATLPSEVNAMDGTISRLKRVELELPKENAKSAVHDPTLNLISETASQKSGQLANIIKDANVKFVMGQLDEAGWQAQVKRWRESGGDQMAAEYAKEFARIKAAAK